MASRLCGAPNLQGISVSSLALQPAASLLQGRPLGHALLWPTKCQINYMPILHLDNAETRHTRTEWRKIEKNCTSAIISIRFTCWFSTSGCTTLRPLEGLCSWTLLGDSRSQGTRLATVTEFLNTPLVASFGCF